MAVHLGSTVEVKADPWTRPPTIDRSPVDWRSDGRRQGEVIEIFGDKAKVRWSPPHWMPNAPVMINTWPIHMLEEIK